MRTLITALSLSVLATPALADEVKVPKGQSWRAERPETPPPPAPVLPAFERATLDNGLTLLVTRRADLPLVAFSLVTKGGATYDPKGQAGLTSLTYAMLEEGAGARSALEFSDAVADLGARFSTTAGRDQGSVAIAGLSRNADAMLGLLSDAVRRPTLEADDFQRVKGQTLATLERQRGSPQGLAFLRLPALIYGEDHPFGHPPSGDLDTVKAATLDAVKAHHARILGPKHSALIVVGDVTLDGAKKMAEQHFSDWTAEAEPPVDVPPLDPKKRKKVVLVNKPGAGQTMVLVGRPLFGHGHEDQRALTLANEVFGGSFAARLNMNLREDKGYTYGASAQTAFRNGVGVFVAYSAIRRDVTAPGLAEIFGELKGLKANPPSERELRLAKNGIIRALPGRFERNSAIASAASSIFVYDLALDYYATLGAEYEAVPLDAVREAALEYLKPGVMQILLVGDAEAIRGRVKKLRLGRVMVEQP